MPAPFAPVEPFAPSEEVPLLELSVPEVVDEGEPSPVSPSFFWEELPEESLPEPSALLCVCAPLPEASPLPVAELSEP